MMKEKRKGLLQRGIMMAVSALTIVVECRNSSGVSADCHRQMKVLSDVIVDDSLDAFGSNCIWI